MSDSVEYMNISGRIIILPGKLPDLRKEHFGKSERKILDKFFMRYVPRYLKVVREEVQEKKDQLPQTNMVAHSATLKAKELLRKVQQREERRAYLDQIKRKAMSVISTKKRIIMAKSQRPTVGSILMHTEEASAYYNTLIKKTQFSISDDIGIGILSYNRHNSLLRLLESIRRNTDLKKTTIIISDESTEDDTKKFIRSIKDMSVLDNKERLGVAGNTNRLMHCLSRFRFKIILNDDVEVMMPGWEKLYASAMHETGIHHFCMRQSGIYGAKATDGVINDINGYKISTIKEKPHGAVFAYDYLAFQKVGFFDENFGMYGMEHVDWSNRVRLSGIQLPGHHDVFGSDKFYKIHADRSAVDNRSLLFGEARRKYEQVKDDKKRVFVESSKKSIVAGVTYIVPFREQDRTHAIRVVIQNIKAQLYPYIEIILVEQDRDKRLKIPQLNSIKYVLAKSWESDQPFTKALAFNIGVANSTQDKLILHDADMLVQDNYTETLSNILDNYEGAHIGKSVLYMTQEATLQLSKAGELVHDLKVERSVKYFEGGSLACRYNTYINVGGFSEDFIGYGNEDTEFFSRLSHGCNFYNDRSVDLIHLHHGRSPNWRVYHERNKRLEKRMSGEPINNRLSYMRRSFQAKYKLKSR